MQQWRTACCAAVMAALTIIASSAWGHGSVNDYEADVEAIYLAYYGRPGDPAGVAFWASELEAAEGNLDAIIDAFGTSEEYSQRFAGLNNAERVNNIYQQLFGRDADEAGLAFYIGKLDAGELSLASIALDVLNGVRDIDALVVANKLEVAHAFTDHIEDTGASYELADINDARELLAGVDESNASMTAAVDQLTDLFGLDNASNCSTLEGSFERIQTLVFDAYNCTNSACHGSADNPAGGLDLSADNAYRNLFRVEAAANLSEPMQLVYPGEQAFSFLYQKLAAATEGAELPPGGGSAMPIGSPALSEDHLEAMRLWIRAGAPEFDNVDDVATLLGCSVGTTPTANKIDPPAAPPVGEGVQFVSGPWTVEANSENEVCFATYYDLDQVPGALPDQARVNCSGGAYADYEGDCFAYKRQTLTQDPQSHHSIIDVYTGTAEVDDPRWGAWQCLNGPYQGQACDPEQIGVPVSEGGADCGGPRYACGTPAERAIACTGYGPRDLRRRTVGMGGAQSPVSDNEYLEGVYSALPTRGVIVWNSHAFNLSPEDTTIEQYNNFYFALPEERVHRNRAIFDAKDIFVANVPPYEERTYCSNFVLPRGARLTELGSHAHQRGVLWQTWLPPQDPTCTVSSGCAPNETPADYVSRIYNDPLILNYDPPLAYDSESVVERTLKFCVTYDNGKNYPELLKRHSTSVGTTCPNNRFCAGGVTPGMSCSDDSECGDGGQCDACTVTGGFTTEDEMFILLGNYYIVPVQ